MRPRESNQIYRRRVNRVIDYIKDHLTEPLTIAELARLAHFSPFHFHRIFRSIVGEPLHAFVRRIRLEHAVFRMQYAPKTKLTTIALEAGFASSSDFSRAFKQTYGFSPSRFSRDKLLKESKIRQDLFPNAGYGFGNLPDPRNLDRFRVRLVDWPAQRIAYERVIGSFDWGRVVAAFERLMAWGRRHGLVPGAQLLGTSPDDSDVTPMDKYQVDWCLIVPPGVDVDGDISVGEIPANRFAVVHCAGDLPKVERAWRHLFHTWLPGSGYEPTDAPNMEVYRRTPLELGWETFDFDCYLPVRPLRSR